MEFAQRDAAAVLAVAAESMKRQYDQRYRDVWFGVESLLVLSSANINFGKVVPKLHVRRYRPSLCFLFREHIVSISFPEFATVNTYNSYNLSSQS